MGVFDKISKFKKEFKEKKRAKTQAQLKEVTAELKVAQARGKIAQEDIKLTKALKSSKKALFEAKHPFLSAGIKHAKGKIKEAKKQKKGIFATDNTPNPFVSTGTSPFNQPKKKGKKGKGPGEGIFY